MSRTWGVPPIRAPLTTIGATLVLEIPGNPPSGNRSMRIGRRPYTPANVTDYRERVRSIAFVAVRDQDWEPPDYVGVEVTAYNTRLDIDNLCAEILDSMQPIVYAFDSRVLSLRVAKMRDKKGPRLIVRVEAIDGKDYGYKKPRPTLEDA